AQVDGHDATDRIAAMVAGSRYRAGLAMILIDGTAVGGFNVIDVDSLHERVDRPVVTVTRRKPDLAAIETALRRRFDDWEDRLRLMRRHRVESIRLGQGSLWISYVGTLIAGSRSVMSQYRREPWTANSLGPHIVR